VTIINPVICIIFGVICSRRYQLVVRVPGPSSCIRETTSNCNEEVGGDNGSRRHQLVVRVLGPSSIIIVDIGLTLKPLPHLPDLLFPNHSTTNPQSTLAELNYETQYVSHPDHQILFSKFLSIVEKVPPKVILVT
jgi:hypothetical protein